MFAYQMRRNCENAVYAHNITNASMRLPRSRRCEGLTISDIARVRTSCVSRNVTYVNAESPHPMVKLMPNMLEYHFGSSDMTQSTDASVSVRTIMASPAADHLRRCSSVSGARSS